METPPLPQIEGVVFRQHLVFVRYAGDSDGNVWSCCRQGNGPVRINPEWAKIATKPLKKSGYLTFGMADDRSTKYVHLFVLELFAGPRPHAKYGCHKNGKRQDNRPSNLKWGTKKEVGYRLRDAEPRQPRFDRSAIPPLPIVDGIQLKQHPKCPMYCGGSDGSTWSCWNRGGNRGVSSSWRRMNQSPDGKYLTITVCEGQKRRKIGVHQFIAECFIGDRPIGSTEVNHFNGNPIDNRPVNLYYGNEKTNATDRDRHGRTARGERCTRSSNGLTEQEALAAVRLRKQTGWGAKFICKELKIPAKHRAVEHLIYDGTWKHLQTDSRQ